MNEQKAPFPILPILLPALNEGVAVLSPDGTIALCNDVAARLIRLEEGARGRRLIGWELGEVCRIGALTTLVGEAIADGEEFRGEVNHDAGHVRRVAVTILPRIKKGALEGIVLILLDRTEIWRLERVRQDFVANVSHELRTPIAAIRGWSETLASGQFDLPEFVQEQLLTIHRHAERLTALVNDLLTLAKAESVGLENQFVSVSLERLIDDVLAGQSEALESKGMNVHVRIAEPARQLFTEPRALEYVLRNLIENAAKYSPEGGEIFVTADVRKKGRLRIAVRDTGSGIEKQHLTRLFERFYRVDKGRSRAVGGTGLGLAIVKHFVSALGGDVKVYSDVGVGTEFVVRLPRESWQVPEESERSVG